MGLLGIASCAFAGEAKVSEILRGHEEVIGTLIDNKAEKSEIINLQNQVKALELKIGSLENKEDVYKSKYDDKFKKYLDARMK